MRRPHPRAGGLLVAPCVVVAFLTACCLTAGKAQFLWLSTGSPCDLCQSTGYPFPAAHLFPGAFPATGSELGVPARASQDERRQQAAGEARSPGSLTCLEVLPTDALFPPHPLRRAGGSDRDPLTEFEMQHRAGGKDGRTCSQHSVLCPTCQDGWTMLWSARPRGPRVLSLETRPGEQSSRNRKV